MTREEEYIFEQTLSMKELFAYRLTKLSETDLLGKVTYYEAEYSKDKSIKFKLDAVKKELKSRKQ